MIVLLPLLASSAFGKAAIAVFGGDSPKDTAFMALLFGTVTSLLKVLWEANSKNHNALKLYLSILTALLFPVLAIVAARQYGIEQQAKAGYMVLTALIAVTLPWILSTSTATSEHRTYWWALYITTLGVSAGVFGFFHWISVDAKPLLTGGTDIFNDGTSSLLVAPMAAGMAGTTWAVLQFSAKHHHDKSSSLTADPSHWSRIYLYAAVILATAYSCFFIPSAIDSDTRTVLQLFRSVATCSLLLLSPILAVTIHDQLYGFTRKNAWLTLPAAGLLIGMLCATAVAIILKVSGSQFLPKDLYYLVAVHSLVGLLSMITYVWISHIMLNYPWPWVQQVADAIGNRK